MNVAKEHKCTSTSPEKTTTHKNKQHEEEEGEEEEEEQHSGEHREEKGHLIIRYSISFFSLHLAFETNGMMVYQQQIEEKDRNIYFESVRSLNIASTS